LKLDPVKTKCLERRLPSDYFEDLSGLAQIRLGLKPIVGETEGFRVSQGFGMFSKLEKAVQLFLAIQYDIPIEYGTAEMAEDGRHERTSSERRNIFSQ
jgi:hypothetical protein